MITKIGDKVLCIELDELYPTNENVVPGIIYTVRYIGSAFIKIDGSEWLFYKSCFKKIEMAEMNLETLREIL